METKEQLQYKKMTETPIPKLVLTLGIPTTISMLITNIYNMADTYFVSQISLTASGATGIVFSVMAILQAFGFMFGHGAGSNISRLLGAKNTEKATTFASTGFFMSILTGLLIMILGLTFLTPLMRFLGSTETILNDAKTYAFFILIAGPAFTSACVLNNILRYEGRATFAMFGLCAGGILNMIMDPILIFGLHMDIAGAGLSTTISQYISVLILLLPYLQGKTSTKIHIKYFTKELKDIPYIAKCGAPSLFRQGLNTVSTSLLNIMAQPYGDAAIASMSVVARCGNLLFSTALGVAQGFQPVCAFNYGSKKYDRVKKACIFTISFGVGIIGLCSLLCLLKAETIIGLFRKDPEVLLIGSAALRYFSLAIITLPITSVGSMLFQGVGRSGKASFIACIQSGLIYVPLIIILPNMIGLKGIQIAQPISYLIAAIITLPIIISFFKELDKLCENS